MIDLKREDFTKYLSEILNVSRQTASNKLNGDGEFTTKELTILVLKLGITSQELFEAIINTEGMTASESDRVC